MINKLSANIHYNFLQCVIENNKSIMNGNGPIKYISENLGITDIASEIVMKGSRYGGKTMGVAQSIVEDMMENKNHCWIVVMPLLKDHPSKTMREIEEQIDIIDKKSNGFKNLWRKISDKSLLRYNLEWPDGHKQEIRFMSLDEAASAGEKPLPNTCFIGVWGEELTSSDEKSKTDYDEKQKLIDNINTLRKTLIRHIPNNETFLEIYTFNPYNKGEPLLEKHNKYLKDNRDMLWKYGFDFRYVEKEHTLLITSNYHQNIYLNNASVKDAMKTKKINPIEYDIVGLGMSGSPSKYQFSHIRHIIDEPSNEGYKTKWEDFQVIRGGIDVGESQAKTSMGLFGYDKNKKAYTTMEIFTYKPKDKSFNANNHIKNIIKFLLIMVKLKENELKNYDKIPFTIDGAAGEFIMHLKDIIPKFQMERNVDLSWLEFRAFPEEWKKSSEWRIKDKRQPRWEKLLSSKLLIIPELNDKSLYDELVNLPLDENGKREDKNTDCINRAEMSMGKWFLPAPKKKIKRRK